MKKILLITCLMLSVSLWSQKLITVDETTGHSVGLGIYYDSMLPLGFSKDGNFIYLNYHNGDAISFWSLHVKSLVTDELLYYNDWSDDGYKYDTPDFLTVLENESDLLESIFFKYSIENESQMTISEFPLHSANKEFNVQLNVKDIETDEYLLTMGLQASTVEVIVSNGEGSKKIANYEQHKESRVFGYIKSPYEERIAVLILKASLGFEGTTAHSFSIYGCSLEYGFK